MHSENHHFKINPKASGYRLRTTCTIAESGSGNATWFPYAYKEIENVRWFCARNDHFSTKLEVKHIVVYRKWSMSKECPYIITNQSLYCVSFEINYVFFGCFMQKTLLEYHSTLADMKRGLNYSRKSTSQFSSKVTNCYWKNLHANLAGISCVRNSSFKNCNTNSSENFPLLSHAGFTILLLCESSCGHDEH